MTQNDLMTSWLFLFQYMETNYTVPNKLATEAILNILINLILSMAKAA